MFFPSRGRRGGNVQPYLVDGSPDVGLQEGIGVIHQSVDEVGGFLVVLDRRPSSEFESQFLGHLLQQH